ncbi:cytoplasmic tRNA 2-thiolation protein 2 [Purpureocillium lilacinum]|nr:cytoplasmic tRNA 2-thiolation protein 2 [Purpureocillium lilacinum]
MVDGAAEQPPPRPCKRCKATPAPYILRNDPTCRDCYVDYVEAKAGRRLGAVARETRTSAAPAPRRYIAGLSFGASSAVMTRVLDGSAKYHSSAKKGSAAAAFEALVVHVDTDLRFRPPPPQSPSPPHSSSPPTTSSSSSSSSPRCCSPAAARLLDRYRARFPNVSFACVHLSRALRLRTVDWAALLPPGAQKPEETLEQANDANGKNGNGENSDDSERLRRFLDRLPSATARADVTRLLVRHVLLDMALAGSYSALLLGHSTTALAALTLAEVANGRGYSVPWQVNDGLYPVRTYGDDSNSNGPSGGDGAAEEEGQQQQQRNAAEEVQQEGTRGKKEKETTLAHVPVFYPMREVFGAEITQYLDLAPELGELVAAAAAVTSSSLSSSGTGTGTGSIVSHKDLSIAEVMSRYFASVEGPYEGIVANVVRTTGKLDRTAPSSSSSAPGAGLCGLCGMALDEQGDSRWAGELGDEEEEEEDDGDCIPGRSPRARLCYGCKRSVNG